MTGDLHSALKTTVIADVTEGGVNYKHVRLQHGKDNFVYALHARPNSYTSAGIQVTDFLNFLGFSRSPCAFQVAECYCRAVPVGQDISALGRAIAAAFNKFERGAAALESCGLPFDQPEGWGFFYGKPSTGRRFRGSQSRGNGHVAPKSERMKEAEDTFFKYVFTWIDGAGERGWTTHYRAKHMPLTPEFQAALDFLGGFSWFEECPEFDFDGCWWRFTPYREEESSGFNRGTEYAHQRFDAHATQFSPGLELLLAAHAELVPHELSFLSLPSNRSAASVTMPRSRATTAYLGAAPSALPERFDVALSFAGTERVIAKALAERVQNAGFAVFYDDFYPEQLWGKDLAAFFDRVYRKISRFCVMFVSREYGERMWTTHERRSAQARAVEEKGREYVLPIRIDDTDLDGLASTIGYVSLKDHTIDELADLLIGKLRAST